MRITAFHGTTSEVMEKIASGKPFEIQRVFQDSNVSLGGAYITKDPTLAAVYAKDAAEVLGGSPVVLRVKVDVKDLLPDEDWIVRIFEEVKRLPPRIQRFMDDLFVGYPGEGFSLSDHYKVRYEELNAGHGITWRDSWKYGGTARMNRPLEDEDIMSITRCLPWGRQSKQR